MLSSYFFFTIFTQIIIITYRAFISPPNHWEHTTSIAHNFCMGNYPRAILLIGMPESPSGARAFNHPKVMTMTFLLFLIAFFAKIKIFACFAFLSIYSNWYNFASIASDIIMYFKFRFFFNFGNCS